MPLNPSICYNRILMIVLLFTNEPTSIALTSKSKIYISTDNTFPITCTLLLRILKMLILILIMLISLCWRNWNRIVMDLFRFHCEYIYTYILFYYTFYLLVISYIYDQWHLTALHLNINIKYNKMDEIRKNSKNIFQIDINAQNNKMKTKISINKKHKCPPIEQTYIKQYFNPHRLAQLVLTIVKNCAQSIDCRIGSKQGNKVDKKQWQRLQSQSVRSIFNCPNISILLVNVKLYDKFQIRRENQILAKLQLLQTLLLAKCKAAQQAYPNSTQTPNKLCAIQTKNQKIINKKSSNLSIPCLKLTTKNTTIINLIIETINTNYLAFTILSNRLNDLTAFIVGINNLVKNKILQQQIKIVLFNTIGMLEEVCQFVLGVIKKIKTNTQVYTKFAINQAQIQQNQQQNIGLKCQNKSSRDKPLYNAKNIAKKLLEQLKQVQQKYTNMSKQIIARQNKYKQQAVCNPNSLFRIKINCAPKTNKQNHTYRQVHFNAENTEYRSHENENYLALPNSGDTFFSNDIGSCSSVLYRSILKKRRQLKNNEKRISLQVITALLQSQRREQIKKLFGDKQSRFVHRQGINIGSGRTVGNDIPRGNLRNKKQVKIETLESEYQDLEQNKSVKGKNKSKSNYSSKSVSIKDKNKQNVYQKDDEHQGGFKRNRLTSKQKLKIMEQLQSKQKSSKNIEQLKKKRRFSCQEDNSIQSIEGNKSRGRIQRLFPSRRNVRRPDKKYSDIHDYPSVSSQNSQKQIYKSMLNIKDQTNFVLDKQLERMLMLALEKKKQYKNGGRSGHLIPIRQSAQTPIEKKSIQRVDILYKRNKKKQKSKVLYRNHQKQAVYVSLLKSSKQINNEKSGKTAKNIVSTKQIDSKSSRRIGLNGALIPEKIIQQPTREENKSQTMRNSGSRDHYFSNKRMTYVDDENFKRKLAKTQENESQYYKIPDEFRVNTQDREAFVQNYVKFYPNMQCTLHKTVKINRKIEQRNNQIKYNNLLQQFGQMPNLAVKKFVNVDFQPEIQQMRIKRRFFREEEQKIRFSKRFITASNQLQQKQMLQSRKFKQNGLVIGSKIVHTVFQDPDFQQIHLF